MTAEPKPDWPEWSIGGLGDLADPGARGFCVGEAEWPFRGFVVRQGMAIFAYANICPHRRHPLDFLPDAFLVDDGKLIRCSSHGALFDPATGLCVAGPCGGESLLALPVRVDADGNIFVTAPDSLRKAGPIIGSEFHMEPGTESDTNR